MDLSAAVVLVFIVLFSIGHVCQADFSDLPGPYCANRPGGKCCPGRDDKCTMPVLGTLCYCDMFCARTSGTDCCPDFRYHCLGEPKPEAITAACTLKGRALMRGQRVKVNCNWCTCQERYPGKTELVCDEEPCLIRPKIIDDVNQGHWGWRASNYSFFWGETLAEGVERHLGTMKPEQLVLAMHGVDMSGENNFEEHFDARTKWPEYIQPIRDQGVCGSSWAISTADVAADRLAILTKGTEKAALSVQQMLDCQNGAQQGCKGGYPDRAWRYLAEQGVVSESCYPYTSGTNATRGQCLVKSKDGDLIRCPGKRGEDNTVYKTPPPYRIASNEHDIKTEISKNGPVQAILLVREDFYMYRSGVYRYADPIPHEPDHHRKAGLHSVRIIGWGMDRSQRRPVKYWLCANSWGRQWGEDGYFRILRGEDESAIEMFVVGVWAKRAHNNNHNLHDGGIVNIL